MTLYALFPLRHEWSLLVLVALGLPLVYQDIKFQSVSAPLLIFTYGIWCSFGLLFPGWSTHLAEAGVTLIVGTLLLVFFPGRLGEADVIFMSGLAFLLNFWSLLVALALSCLAALGAYTWSLRLGGHDERVVAIPFLPSLFWGGLTVIMGKI